MTTDRSARRSPRWTPTTVPAAGAVKRTSGSALVVEQHLPPNDGVAGRHLHRGPQPDGVRGQHADLRAEVDGILDGLHGLTGQREPDGRESPCGVPWSNVVAAGARLAGVARSAAQPPRTCGSEPPCEIFLKLSPAPPRVHCRATPWSVTEVPSRPEIGQRHRRGDPCGGCRASYFRRRVEVNLPQAVGLRPAAAPPASRSKSLSANELALTSRQRPRVGWGGVRDDTG